MKKMRIIACDDDRMILDLVEAWTKEYMGESPYQYISHNNGIDLLNEMENYKGDEPQIFFMDIKLKNDNGIDVAKILNKVHANIAIIFISGYTEYFEDSFEAEPVFFLIKPLKKEAFEKALKKAVEKVSRGERKYLMIKGKEIRRVFYDEIYYGESVARKVHLYGSFGEIEFYGKMDDLETMLKDGFVRCHKSFLVNMRHVQYVDSKEVTLLDETKIPVSKKRAGTTKEQIFQYLGGRF